MKFLRNLLAVLVGLGIFFGLFFVIGIGIVASSTSDDSVPLEGPGILRLKLSGPIVERAEPNPFAEFVPFAGTVGTGLHQIKSAIREAKNDPNIQGILLEPSLLAAGYATLREIRQELISFQEDSDKFVIAYGEIFTEGDYYLASAAEQVYLHPVGDVEFNGLSSEVTYIKGTLDKLGVEPQIFRVGQYKSAVEPLMRTDMSDASREQITSYLNAMYATYLQDVAASRNTDVATLSALSKAMTVRNGALAKEHGLVDDLKYFDEILALMNENIGKEEGEDLKLYSLTRYLNSFDAGDDYSSNRVAVIYGEGSIASGSSTNGTIGSDDFAREIRKARENDRVKAIVIRVNSPGGSALASDVIWREVKLAAEEKPVIASMGDVAASGGYYIAMAADQIVAQPNTITGSIGIFGVLFNAQELLNDKLGVTTETVNTGDYSGLFTMSRPLTPAEKDIIQRQVEAGYETFTGKAAEGRGMNIDDLKALAGGRVWAGNEALENGLVDRLGSLDDAIQLAAEEAGIADDYMVKHYPQEKSLAEELEELLSGRTYEERMMQEQFGEHYRTIKMLRNAAQYEGIQARLPYEVVIY